MSFYSQFGEDRYMTTLFPDGYVGTCVEIGAYDGVAGSNTFHFEQKNWKCLCIEPNPSRFQHCARVRKQSVNCCVGDASAEDVPFYVYTLDGNNQAAISSLRPDPRLITSHQHMLHGVTPIRVRVRTLTEILQTEQFPTRIDFVSVDTENTELDVLKGIDFSLYTIDYFIVENNYDEPDCAQFLAQHGYTKIHRTGVNDIFKRV